MKLKTLELTDLLSHVSSKIDLAPTLTVLTGVSDSGKSGIMRGLRQLCLNQPSGINLLRHGAKRGACSETRLSGVGDDGAPFTVARRRSKSRNEYEVNGTTLLSFGTGTPEEVDRILKLSSHAFQIQNESNFLLSRTAGEVAKAMSGTIGLAQIDAAFTAIRKRKSENDNLLRIAESDVLREGEAAAKYAGLEEAERLVAEATSAASLLSDKRVEVLTIEGSLLEFEAVLPDNSDLVDAAVAAAEKSAKISEAVVLSKTNVATVDVLIAQFYALPVPINDDAFPEINVKVLELEAVQQDISRLKADIAAIDALLAQGAIPQPAQCVTADRAVVVYGTACDARQTLQQAVSAIDYWIGNLEGLAKNCDLKIENAESEIETLGLLETKRRTAAEQFVEMNRLYSDLSDCGMIGELIGSEENKAIEDLEHYLAEHPVCPECGAEQKHWHINR